MASETAARIDAALRTELERGCEARVFPGASASVGFREGDAWSAVDVSVGGLGEGRAQVTEKSIYDLASVTKPWVAMTAVNLHQAGRFDIGGSVFDLIPEAEGLPVGERSWEDVLTHRSGLDAWHAFYEEIPAAPGSDETRTWLLSNLLPRWQAAQVGTALYSDLGYILAGLALSRATGATLDALVAERLSGPLGLEDEAFFAATREEPSWRDRCATTGPSVWRGRELLGEVHDDNCAALGGVAGHAGMFGTARAVRTFGCAWVAAWHGRRGALDEEGIQFALTERPGGTHRLGWDGKAETGSAAGSRMGPRSFGHLGFTGTSLWCDPDRELVIALLTNRVAVSDDNTAIRAFRPVFHDAVTDAFDG
jgi:CubicO group peptidase (beta-lactamase class C family)